MFHNWLRPLIAHGIRYLGESSVLFSYSASFSFICLEITFLEMGSVAYKEIQTTIICQVVLYKKEVCFFHQGT